MQDSFDKYISGEKRTILLVSIIIFLIVVYNPFEKTSESLLLSLIIILISFFPFILWRRNKHRNIVIPGILWYFFFHMIGYGLAGFIGHQSGIGVWIEGKQVDTVTDESEIIAKSLVVFHLIVVLVSVHCLKYFFPNKKSSNKELKQTYSNSQFKFSIYFCIFFVFLNFLIATNILPPNLLVTLAGYFSFMYLFYFLFYLNYGHWILKLAAAIGFLIISGVLISPSTIYPYTELAIILTLIRLQRGRIPIVPIGALLLVFILFQPMKGVVRQMTDLGNYGVTESVSTGFDFIEDFSSLDLIDLASKRIDYNLLLTSFIDNIGVANSSDFIGWKGYEHFKYVVIPRVIWPSKPSVDTGNEWAVQEGYLGPDDYWTSYNLPLLPQMYLSFGSKGIIIGSFIIAALLFFLEKFYWTLQPNAWSFAVGYSIMRAMITLESDFVLVFGVVIKIILMDIFLRFIFKLLRSIKSKKEVSYQ